MGNWWMTVCRDRLCKGTCRGGGRKCFQFNYDKLAAGYVCRRPPSSYYYKMKSIWSPCQRDDNNNSTKKKV